MTTQTQTHQTPNRSTKSQGSPSALRTSPSTGPSGPSHEIFHIRDRGSDKKGFWQKVGVAFRNRDGSLTLKLNYLPAGPSDDALTLQLRDFVARKTDDNGENGDGSERA